MSRINSGSPYKGSNAGGP